MKRNILYLCVIALFSSCSGFLDEEPKGSITTESYYKTEQHAVTATNAIYDYIIAGYSPGGLWDNNFGGVFFNYYWVLQDVFSDNAKSQITSSTYQSIDNFQIDAYNEPLEYLWRDFYQVIKTCNVVIDHVPAIEMDETLKNNLLSEARFFRAYMYFDLVRMFGPVPLRVHDMNGAEDEQLPRASEEDIYTVILDDLKFAEKNMNYSQRQGGGRPYALSATALLARVYNTLGAERQSKDYYQLAIDCAKKVIPSFPLQEKFADLFLISNRFNSEIIWGANFNTTLSEGWKGGQFLVRLLPSLDTSLGGPDNAQGWEVATDDLYSIYSSLDQRRNVTLAKSFTYNDGSKATLNAPYIFKYWDREAEPHGNSSDAVFPAIRTAEMYLIIAEALNEINGGPNDEAREAIQTVRKRSGIVKKPDTTYEGFKKHVLEEYRKEFVMEGHRWFDMKRMLAPEEFVSFIQAVKPDATPKAYHRYFPIPQHEINLSQGLITQNEGYETK